MGEPSLSEELDKLQSLLPGWAKRQAASARKITSLWVRLPVALVLIVGGIFGFLPILGFWVLPLGLALLARDVPVLRGPLARLLAFVNRRLAAG